MSILLEQLLNGLSLGLVYALIALGYTMVYGILRMINFSHGEVFMVGGFVGWGVITGLLAGPGRACPASSSCCGARLRHGRVRGARLRDRADRIPAAAKRARHGRHHQRPRRVHRAPDRGDSRLRRPVQADPDQPGPAERLGVTIGGVTIPFVRLVIVAVSILLLLALEYLVLRTRWGRATRATAQDLEAAAFMGVDVDRVVSLVYVTGSALAGVAGVLVGLLYTQVDFAFGFFIGIKAFTAAVIGGIGFIRGAFLGGLVLGWSRASPPGSSPPPTRT